jgi:hypothetical protein
LKQIPKNFLSIQIKFNLSSVFDFSFTFRCDSIQVVNIKVSPNGPIYLMEKFHIFVRPRSISYNLFFVSALMEKIKEKTEIQFSFLTGSGPSGQRCKDKGCCRCRACLGCSARVRSLRAHTR